MGDQDPNALSKLLQEHDLSPNKWVPLFRKEGITTKIHITVNMDSDELFESLLSKAYTEKEKRGLRKLLGIHDATHNADNEIEKELGKAGLEPTAHWLSVFRTQLGVRTPEGLQQIGSESYAELERFACKPWEKKSLRKLLGVPDEEIAITSLRKGQKEKLQQRETRSKQLLKQLKDLRKQGKDHHDKMVMQLMDDVQEALQIPGDTSIVKDSSLEALLDGFKMNTHQLGRELKASQDLKDVKILQRASGGRTLQGVLVSKNLQDQFEVRENLLSVPQAVQLKAPFLWQENKVKEFSSQYQEDQFTKSMDRLGYSATSSAKAGFGVQMCTSYSESTMGTRTGKHHQKENYCSTIKYLFVPIASFHFKHSQLQLSAGALRELQAIEAFSGSQDGLQEKCEKFFRKYGSHASKGHFHFGGVYWLKCYSYGFHESELAEVKNLQSQALSASFGFLYGFGAPVEGNVSKLKTILKGNFSEALMSNTIVEVTKKGGPQSISNIPLWKSGLVASNSTWSVIDCGSNTVPVWEIIQVQLA